MIKSVKDDRLPCLRQKTKQNSQVKRLLDKQISFCCLLSYHVILWNADYGIFNTQYSYPEIIHNHITGNGTGDIFVNFDSTPNISFNTYDDITGTTGVGMYNVNGGGGPAPDP